MRLSNEDSHDNRFLSITKRKFKTLAIIFGNSWAQLFSACKERYMKLSKIPNQPNWNQPQGKYLNKLVLLHSAYSYPYRKQTIEISGSCHKRQKPQAPTPQAPIRNRQTRKVVNATGLNRNTNLA